jgi:hypothetical protein
VFAAGEPKAEIKEAIPTSRRCENSASISNPKKLAARKRKFAAAALKLLQNNIR